jgi:hypothetical protein
MMAAVMTKRPEQRRRPMITFLFAWNGSSEVSLVCCGARKPKFGAQEWNGRVGRSWKI